MTASRDPHLRWLLVLCTLTLGEAFLFDTAAAAQDFCDPSLPRLRENPQGYRMRADRCEGIYVQELGTTILQLASLTGAFEEIDHTSGRALVVEWDRPPCGGEVHIRAQGLRRRLYYRMDTARAASATSYSWPIGILAAQGLHRNDIGVMAWTRCRVGAGARETNVFMPVTIRQKGNAPASRSHQLILIPGVELSEVYISLAAGDTKGRAGEIVKNKEALGYGYYPAERRVEIQIPDVKTPGLYHLELAAHLRSGGTSTTEFWFYRGKE